MDALLQDSHIWLVISFALFLAVAWKFGRGSVATMLDGRIEAVRKDIAAAQAVRAEAKELLERYKARQRDAQQEAVQILEDARRHAAEIQAQAEKDLSAQMARKEAQLAERLRRMEEDAIAEIKAKATALAVQAAARMIAEQMDDATRSALIDRSISEVSKSIN